MTERTETKRFTLREAAQLLGCSYATLRKYVVEKEAVPHERRGITTAADAKPRGCLVLIDESGLESLRRMLPPIPVGTLAG